MLEVENLKVGWLQTNVYILKNGDECMIIDPGDEPQRILDACGDSKVKYIFLTHYHWDHTGAVPTIVEETGATILAHELDADKVFGTSLEVRMPKQLRMAHARAIEQGMKVDQLLQDGDIVTLGDAVFTVIHTPGHSPGSICLHCPEENLLFAGDTLFSNGRHGRTDFADGSQEDMNHSLATKFLDVDDNTIVFSGHEGNSNMARERALNPKLA